MNIVSLPILVCFLQVFLEHTIISQLGDEQETGCNEKRPATIEMYVIEGSGRTILIPPV